MKNRKDGKAFVLYNSASAGKYGVKIIEWIKLLTGPHLVDITMYHLGSWSVKIFHGVPLN